MSYRYLTVETKDWITQITINRPDVLNALNSDVLEDLHQAFQALSLDETRVVVITGAGDKAFVAGADISQMKEMTREEGEAFGKKGNEVFRAIETCPVPVIAAVNGYALGGGNELALSCDIRLAAETAVFGQPEVGLGITPGFGGTQRLARVTGSISKAKELIYSARNIKAPEALRIGLVSDVYPAESLMAEVMKLASRIAANAPIAVRNCKKAINEGLELTVEEGTALEAKLFGACFATEDQKEGMTAFLEKRKDKQFNNR